jgi:hypothetical protein
MELISRYDEDFFDCMKGHVVSFFKQKNVPIELLFYNTLEKSSSIFAHYLLFLNHRWNFPSEALSIHESTHIGVQIHPVFFDTFEKAEPHIQELFQREEIVFLIVDEYYIPHRSQYQKRHGPHSLMISQIKDDNGKKSVFVQDHLRPDFYNYYDYDIIADAFNHSEMKHVVHFTFDEQRMQNPNVEKIKEIYLKWLGNYKADYDFYNKLTPHLIHHSEELMTWMEQIEQAMVFIKSSRKLFALFLNSIKENETAIDLLHQCVRQLDLLHNLIVIYSRTKRLNLELIQEKCNIIKESERSAIHILQNQPRTIKGELMDGIS